MKIKKLKWPKAIIPIMLTVAVILLFADNLMAQTDKPGGFFPGARVSEKSLLTFSVFLVLGAIAFAAWKVYKIIQSNLQKVQDAGELELDEAVKKLNAGEISEIQKVRNRLPKLMIWLVLAVGTPLVSSAQDLPATRGGMMSEPGVVITILLVLIPIFAGVVFALFKARRSLLQFFESRAVKREVLLARGIARETKKFSDSELRERKERLEFALSDNELSGTSAPGDDRGLIGNIKTVDNPRFFSVKRPSIKRPKIDPQLSNLILWYLGTAVFWLLLGTSAGEYVGIKFTAPDLDSISWLSIGRLRPVHTNLVFWGWSTLGIMGLGYYIVPTVSNAKIDNLRRGYLSLICVNVAMLAGMILLMAGINNGGGEYREIVWPAMAVWGYGLFLTLLNFISTVSKRTTKEIYISNWYIISAYIFILIVATIAYLPMGGLEYN
ncbi:cbb3-type cytochrome c oxidase subunit I [Pedobacter suwonensis]|uniref:cbb3-type cytochrome c oxidase subunit I n=1 Tax=Pedobacter suwonensis TaxID=332999 RepID=UPI003D092892